MTGMKDQKRPNTLMEYMGFKDEDIKTESHDEIVLLLSKKEKLTKIVKKLCFSFDGVNEIVLEKVLSDDYKQYGFLDIYFEFGYNLNYKGYGFIEVKSKPQTIGSLVREMEYYKTICQKLWSRRFDATFLPIIISPIIIPDHIKQFHSLTFEMVKDIIQ